MLNVTELIGFGAFTEAGSTGITYVGAGTPAYSGQATIGLPTGVQSGDLLVILASSGSTQALTDTTGWTQILADESSGQRRVFAWWKVAGSSETSNSFTVTNSRLAAVMLAYRGAAASPFDVDSAANSGTDATAETLSITTTVANALVIGMMTTSDSETISYPAVVNQRINYPQGSLINGSNYLMIWDEIQASAGASTVRTATALTTMAWVTYSAAFKPA